MLSCIISVLPCAGGGDDLRNMVEWITIQEVLAEIERVAHGGQLVTFSLAFVRANNSKSGTRGSIKRVPRAAKYTKPGKKIRKDQPNKPSTSSWQFKAHDALPIQDLDNDQLLTPKWTHIVEFNNKKVRHYGT